MAEVKPKTICFDLDGVLCSATTGDYENAVPNTAAIHALNALHEQGFRIIINTSRFMGRNQGDPIRTYKEGYQFTLNQLNGWGVKYDDLFMGKPVYDLVIDDRAIFFKEDWQQIRAEVLARTAK